MNSESATARGSGNTQANNAHCTTTDQRVKHHGASTQLHHHLIITLMIVGAVGIQGISPSLVDIDCTNSAPSPEEIVNASSCACVAGYYFQPDIVKCSPCGMQAYCPGDGYRHVCQTDPDASSRAATCAVNLSTGYTFSLRVEQCKCIITYREYE